MAASAGSPPASWKAWRASASPPTATASATTTGCSARSSRMAGSRNIPRTGCPSATPGNSSGRRSPTTSASAAWVETVRGATAGIALSSGIPPRPSRRWPTTRRSSAGAARTSITLRLWSARAVDPLRLDVFNRGDHVGALAEQARAEAISQVLYPSDETPAGQRTAPAAGIFLRLRLAAGPRRAAPAAAYGDAPHAAGAGGDPAQRHASGDRDRRADAPPRRSAQHRLGRRLADHRRHLLTTPTTPCCPRRSKAGRSRCSSGCCRGIMQIIYLINARHLEAAARGAHARFRCDRRDLADRRTRRAARADGAPGVSSAAHRVNGVSALHTDLMRETVFRDLDAVYPGPHRQQDQRHHLPPLAATRPIRA